MSEIIKAARMASIWHDGQERKFTRRPYIEHPGRVAARISRHLEATECRVAAAWLHDVMEDCGVSFGRLSEDFSARTCALVKELTNPSKQCPALTRAERKKMDREHIATASKGARLIKLADRTDNLREVEPGTQFAQLYAAESRLLLAALAGTDPQMEDELAKAIVRADAVPA